MPHRKVSWRQQKSFTRFLFTHVGNSGPNTDNPSGHLVVAGKYSFLLVTGVLREIWPGRPWEPECGRLALQSSDLKFGQSGLVHACPLHLWSLTQTGWWWHLVQGSFPSQQPASWCTRVQILLVQPHSKTSKQRKTHPHKIICVQYLHQCKNVARIMFMFKTKSRW